MGATVSKVGNYLCHALSIGGCEHSHVIQSIGYAALLIPLVVVATIIMHGGHR
jgi:hypothetical protein